MVLRINKKGFPQDYLISLIKRLKIEELSEKSGFTDEILHVAEEINQKYWNENSESFLKGVKK